MIVDFAKLTPQERYIWMTGAVIPRPVAWVLSENDGGDYNLAPFSYFNALCSAPPLVGISFTATPGGGMKDTLANIRKRKKFVVHIAPMKMLDSLNDTSAPLPYGESELSRLRLPTEEFWDLPRLRDCPLAFACGLSREISLHGEGDAEQIMILGGIARLYADESVMTNDAKDRPALDAAKIDPIARLSAGNYAGLSNFQTRARPVK